MKKDFWVAVLGFIVWVALSLVVGLMLLSLGRDK